MAKAGSVQEMPNLRFIRSGLTIQQHVAVAGEVIPLPSGFNFMSKEEQLRYYRKVFYERTNDPINTGPLATVAFVRVPEPYDGPEGRTAPEAVGVPGMSEIKQGGGGGQAQIPEAARTAPDPLTVPDHEDPTVLAALAAEREADLEAAGAAPRGGVIVLTRIPIKRKKKVIKARATRMERR